MATTPVARRTGGRTPPGTYVPVAAKSRLQLTDRDIAMLIWITRHGFVTMEQITRRWFPSPHGRSAAYQRVQKLCAAAPPFLERVRTFYQQPSVIRVTLTGARLADVGLGPAKIVEAQIRHDLAIVDLVEELSALHPDATFLTERERRAELYREKRAGQRPATGRIPDAIFIFPATRAGKERTVAIELDRSPKSRRDNEAVVKGYLTAKYSEVWWYVLPHRVEPVRQIVRRMRTDDFIEVRPWDGA